MSAKLLQKNRKALHNFQLVEKYIAGIVLKGHEVKALREGKVSFEGSYIEIQDGIPVILNLYIGKYSKQSSDFSEYNSKRKRHLLLNKKEIDEIDRQISQKGKTAVPLALVLEHGFVKLELAVVKGKKEFEKKATAKDRQIQKDLDKEAKEHKKFSW